MKSNTATANMDWLKSPDTMGKEQSVEYKKNLEAIKRVLRRAAKKMEEQLEQEQIERDYRKWEHDQRMMWARENDGSNQCIPAKGWAVLLNRIANRAIDAAIDPIAKLRISPSQPRLSFTL